MGRGRRLLIGLAAVGLLGGAGGWGADPPAATTRPAGGMELSAEAAAALAGIEDFVFNFDQPGFYAVVEAVKRSAFAPEVGRMPVVVEDWRDFLERPSEFRGRVVTVEGVVGRSKDPYTLNQRPELGQFWQIELSLLDQAPSCTIVMTEDASDIPIGARIRVAGYFVMVRQYYGPTNRLQQAALLVAKGPTLISQSEAASAGMPRFSWQWMVAAVVAALVVTIFLLWRTSAGGRSAGHVLRAVRPAPMNLADDLQSWADGERREPPDTHDLC